MVVRMNDPTVKTSLDRVFVALRPGCFYRVADVAVETGLSKSTARYALRQLSGGGVIELVSKNPAVFLTKQMELVS